MKFSELFSIKKMTDDDWFDPILSVDTNLFIDPFLIFASEQNEFQGSHADIIDFFNRAFKLVARSNGNPTSVLWKKAENLLRLSEVEEICLGYAKHGTKGSGSGSILANVVVKALWEAVQAGLTEITHFEEIGILREGIGADRISDMTASIVRERLVLYTQGICMKHKVPLQKAKFLSGYFNKDFEYWMPIESDLPHNPYNGKSILLVPKRYLRDLPTINADSFWDYCYEKENETLRNEFSYDITKNVDKATIIDFSRRHPEIRRDYINTVEAIKPVAYNLHKDPRGFIKWYDDTSEYCGHHPISLRISSIQDFTNAIDIMIEEFRNYVENNKGWKLLWNDNGTPRREDAAQFLFLGIIKHYCKANNIDISREPDIGRGPVDFKVSHGYGLRALMELKLARNTRFWNGLEKQLPKYQEAENVDVGYFIVILFGDKDFDRLPQLQERVGAVNEKTGYNIGSVTVDASPDPKSASKL